jgi:hypothetical protein
LIYAAAFIFKDIGLSKKNWFMPLTVGLMTALTALSMPAQRLGPGGHYRIHSRDSACRLFLPHIHNCA